MQSLQLNISQGQGNDSHRFGSKAPCSKSYFPKFSSAKKIHYLSGYAYAPKQIKFPNHHRWQSKVLKYISIFALYQCTIIMLHICLAQHTLLNLTGNYVFHFTENWLSNLHTSNRFNTLVISRFRRKLKVCVCVCVIHLPANNDQEEKHDNGKNCKCFQYFLDSI